MGRRKKSKGTPEVILVVTKNEDIWDYEDWFFAHRNPNDYDVKNIRELDPIYLINKDGSVEKVRDWARVDIPDHQNPDIIISKIVFQHTEIISFKDLPPIIKNSLLLTQKRQIRRK